MKVKFFKDHLQHKEGETADIEEGIAEYLITMGVAAKAKEKKVVDEGKEKASDTKHIAKKKH